jgi:tetratricopeptide (TPR) repeat protein
MAAITGIFNILSLLYIGRSIQLSAVIWREWADLTRFPLTPHKEKLADRAAFFIAVPVGVLIHELGHAVAVWLSGGQVVEFGYRVFWGFVRPAGAFTAAQNWFIAVAGTLGSLAFGLAVWLAGRRAASPTLRYFALRAFRFQIYFSLIYYPVFTLFGLFGDWVTIYNFNSTPLLSGITAVCHAVLLFAFWRLNRRGWFEMPAHDSAEAAEEFAALAKAAEAQPYDPERQLAYVDALRRGGATDQARHRLERLLEQHPDRGVAYLEMALLQSAGKAQIPRAAVDNAEEALRRGLPTEKSRSLAHQLLGQYALDVEQFGEAVEHFSQALQYLPDTAVPLQKAHLHQRRGQAHRRQHDHRAAQADLQQALDLAEAAGAAEQAETYRAQLNAVTGGD